MKQWSDLHFILRKSDNTTLELGKEKYTIVKDNILLCFNNFLRAIPEDFLLNPMAFCKPAPDNTLVSSSRT
jgi:hypothetical protein